MVIRYKYFLYGFFFGCLFPIGAVIAELVSNKLSLSVQNLVLLHHNNLLLYMIDSAPVFLGLFAFLGGISKEKSEVLLHKFREVSRLLIGSNEQLNRDSKTVIETIEKSNELFEEISNEINVLRNDGENHLNQNKSITQVLEKESKEILGATENLISLNKELKTSSQEIVNEIMKFVPLIKNLNQSLMKVNSVGNEINILALNSGVEAHRLGERGKSFSVISKEVKNLSDKISVMNKNMHKLIIQSEQHIDNLHNITVINKNSQADIENISGSIQQNLIDYTAVIEKVSGNLNEMQDIYSNLIKRYDKMVKEISYTNETKDGLINNLRQIIEKEVEMVNDLNNLKK